MPLKLGPRDEERYRRLQAGEREYLRFLTGLALRILDKRPRQLECLERLAAAFTALGYYHDGLQMDRRLAALLPDDPTVTYNLACSLALTGRVEEAQNELERAVVLGYDDAEHMARDQDLLALHGQERFLRLLRRLHARARSPA